MLFFALGPFPIPPLLFFLSTSLSRATWLLPSLSATVVPEHSPSAVFFSSSFLSSWRGKLALLDSCDGHMNWANEVLAHLFHYQWQCKSVIFILFRMEWVYVKRPNETKHIKRENNSVVLCSICIFVYVPSPPYLRELAIVISSPHCF